MELVSGYGVADVNGHKLAPGHSAPMTKVVEKPPMDQAPSNLAVVGRYVLSANIWDLLKHTPVGAGDEIQLTDAIAMLMKQETVNAFNITGKSHDCGSKLSYMMANVEYALRHPGIGKRFRAALKKMDI
jgi:UTP--glucose-1-phosphate uridylyltransferase